MKILNCYAGLGGNRKLWGNDHEITAVELNPEIANIYKTFFPNDNVIVDDAHEYLLDHFKEYEFIWSSPPCQSHSAMARVNAKRYNLYKYPDMKLWQEIIFLNEFCDSKYVIENVNPYYKDLIEPSYKINRHLIWCNFEISNYIKKNIESFIDAKFEDIKKWLGFDNYNERIYLNGTHDYTQILRNCVHPETGLHILNCAITKGYKNEKEIQQSLFKEVL